MKILLINNHTRYLQKILDELSTHDVQVADFAPGVKLDDAGKDLIILSGGGGKGRELKDLHHTGDLWYKDELEFIIKTDKPILGICMGFELIAHAYGSRLVELPRRVTGFRRIQTGQGAYIKQFKHHKWCIPEVSKDHFEVLGRSKIGVEMVRHKSRPILAIQFHPEISGGSLELAHLIKQLQTFSLAHESQSA